MPIKRYVAGCVGIFAAMAAVAGCGGGSSEGGASKGGGQPTIKVNYFDHAAPMQDHLIATNDKLKAMIPAKITFLPTQSGPAALAGYKTGGFQFVESVGFPPIAGAIAAGIKFHVIWPSTLNSASLVVRPDIRTLDDLKGKKIADLVGSGEDYEFKGWMDSVHLKSSIKLVQVTDQQNVIPAFKSNGVDGAYTDLEYASQLMKDGGVQFKLPNGQLVDSQSNCEQLQICSFNSATVSDDFAAQHPDVVQGYVCALYRATQIERSPQADAAFRAAASLTGANPDDAVKAGKALPTADPKSIPVLLSPASSDNPKAGTVAKGITAAAASLEQQGQIHTHLTQDMVQSYMEPKWAANALAGKCGGA